jgi:inosine-uridine nucleoside N-ribohydrolase
MPSPVILCTDIGGDVDDTWALAYLLRCPELDLKLVLTETGEARYRAAIAAKLLEVAGRTDVVVGLGRDFGTMPEQDRHQGFWIRNYELDRYPRLAVDGIQAAVDLIAASPTPVTIVHIAPAPSLAEALRRAPGIAPRCRFVGMHGSVREGYGPGSPPCAESNVRSFPEELRQVLSAPWQEVVLTPLDTCGRVALTGHKFHAIWHQTRDPLLRAVIENHCLWAQRVPWLDGSFFATRSSTLFDCVAVWLAYAHDLVELEQLSLTVTDDGMTLPAASGPVFSVATRWRNLEAFEDHLVERLLTATS